MRGILCVTTELSIPQSTIKHLQATARAHFCSVPRAQGTPCLSSIARKRREFLCKTGV